MTNEFRYTFVLDTYGENVTLANLRYFSYPIDSNGDMLIPEHHMFPLMMFCKYMFEFKEAKNATQIQIADQFVRSSLNPHL